MSAADIEILIPRGRLFWYERHLWEAKRSSRPFAGALNIHIVNAVDITHPDCELYRNRRKVVEKLQVFPFWETPFEIRQGDIFETEEGRYLAASATRSEDAEYRYWLVAVNITVTQVVDKMDTKRRRPMYVDARATRIVARGAGFKGFNAAVSLP